MALASRYWKISITTSVGLQGLKRNRYTLLVALWHFPRLPVTGRQAVNKPSKEGKHKMWMRLRVDARAAA